MPASPVRALVLAAGLGTRLRPLTETCPKPMLPVAGQPLVAHTLAQLARLGCDRVVLNLHYLPEVVRTGLGARFAGMALEYSFEPEILGTLGALAPARELLRGAETVLIVNGDSLCRWPFERLLARHHERGALATLLMSARAPHGEHGGGEGLDAQGRVVRLRGVSSPGGRATRRRIFAGVHAWKPELLERVPDHPADTVADLYHPMLCAGERIEAVETSATWFDLGTPARYLEGALAWVGAARRSWIDPEAQVAPSAEIVHSVIERGVVIDREAKVERSVVLPGARIASKALVRDAVIGFDVQVPAGARVAGPGPY